MRTGNRHEATGNRKKIQVFGFALGAMLFALCGSVSAQQPKKVPRIGFLKAAKQIGLTIPVRVLERANQVIK